MIEKFEVTELLGKDIRRRKSLRTAFNSLRALAVGDRTARTPLDGRDRIRRFPEEASQTHPREIGLIGTVALAMGGSNQCLFLITVLFAGQGDILGQGSATIPLLLAGLLLSYAAAPGWTELVLMSPDRTGGISSVCTQAFRPYGSILSTLTGVCYWWGWVPTCGVTAIMSSVAINSWCLPSVPVPLTACFVVALFTVINLCGVKWVARVAIPIAVVSAGLAFVAIISPMASGQVDWHRSLDFKLITPFPGWFGSVTSVMAGLYLIGFGAPAFEAAACHVGETIDAPRTVPRAMLISGIMAAVYFVVLPAVWLGALGPEALRHNLSEILTPTLAPVFGSLAKSLVIGFLMFNMFHGSLQPLAGAARTLAQLSEDGVAPRFLALRLKTDAPWAATLVTAGFAILFLLIGDPIWLIAAANFTYLIGICLPSVAVWLLRRDAPKADRPYRAPRYTIGLGLVAAFIWAISAVLGFEQFGLPTVVVGLIMAYSGAALYAWRKFEDRRRAGLAGISQSVHLKLTGAMLLVLALDAIGYILAVQALPPEHSAFSAGLADIFVAVALLTITVGIILPGMIAHSVNEVSAAARHLAQGTVSDFARAMYALGAGRLDEAHASVDSAPVIVRSADEIGAMAANFNALQAGVKDAALGLDMAREGLSKSRSDLLASNEALRAAKEDAVYESLHDCLTGLPNRSFFLDCLQRKIDSKAEDFAVCFIDLDRFKTVNDSLGHHAGDELLQQVTRRLKSCLARDNHSKNGDSVLARFGGDEFMILLDGIVSEAKALAQAAMLLKSFEPPFIVHTQGVHCSASLGVTLGAHNCLSAADVLRNADLAMFRAKALGKSRVQLYEHAMHAAARIRLDLENDMHRALIAGEFVLHYQPIVCLSNQKLLGFEALVRWQHPEKGLVPPCDFIPIAEETGFILPLGAWVIREACRKATAWGDLVGRTTAPSISVNLSPLQFAQHDLVAQVRTVLIDTGVNPTKIKLEITESGTIGDQQRAIHVLRALKALGLQICIDDFGVGYSSLSYLHRLPIDILKIDRSFVAGMMRHRESWQVIKTIQVLASSLDMQVIAEGIEDVEQTNMLRDIGCEIGQGYFFSKPLIEVEADACVAQCSPCSLSGGSEGFHLLSQQDLGTSCPIVRVKG